LLLEERRLSILGRLLAGLLGQESAVDVGQDTTSGDGDSAQKLAQLLVVPHGQLDVAGDDSGLLVIAGGVSSQLQDLSSQVLENGGQVDGRAGSHASGVLASLQEPGDTADRELEPGLGGPADGLLAGTLASA